MSAHSLNHPGHNRPTVPKFPAKKPERKTMRTIRNAIAILAAFMLACGAAIAAAPNANAFVLHDDVNETTCAYTAEGSVRMVLYYWSWTDGSGVKWVAMKSGKHIRLDIAAGSTQTVMDPE